MGKKETVYMSISPVWGLEIIKVNTQNKTILSYSNKTDVQYDTRLNDIADYDTLKTAIQELFSELQIKLPCNVVLNLPTTLLACTEVPLLLDDDAVKEFLISEAEQNYIFKRHEPLIAWTDTNMGSSNEVRPLFYSALRQDVLDNVQNVFTEIGATVIGVTVTTCSIINALKFSGCIEKMIQDNLTWNLILVNNDGYALCSMLGEKIADYYEETLMLNSYSDMTEMNDALISSLQFTLMNYPSNLSYIVSNTNIVSAEILSQRLKDADIPTEYFENNSLNKKTILNILDTSIKQYSLEAVGITIFNQPDIPIKLDFMAVLNNAVDADNSPIKFTIGENHYEVTPQTAMKISAIISVILIVPMILLLMIFSSLATKLQANLDTLNEELKKIEAEVKSLSDEDSKERFNEQQEILKTVKNNRSKLMAYSALGETVPDNLWITYFYTRKDGQVDIKGAALSVEDIAIFYKNLKDMLINTKIRLYKLEMASNNIDDAVKNTKQSYQFEITNMSESELSAKNSSGAENEQESVKSNKKGAAKSSSKSKKSKTKSSGAKQNEQSVPDNLPQGLE